MTLRETRQLGDDYLGFVIVIGKVDVTRIRMREE